MRERDDIMSRILERHEPHRFGQLAQPFAGLCSVPTFSTPTEINQPSLDVAVAQLGDLSELFPRLRAADGRPLGTTGLAGACADEDDSVAGLKAIAEAAERYAMSVVLPDEVTIATANELGKDAIDWHLFPRCRDSEYDAFPLLVPFDPDKKMRWVPGISLGTGRRLYVPVALTHICSPVRRAESFTLPISTGVAVHTDIYEALTRAVLEVVERDAIALTWYLGRRLPRLDLSGVNFGRHAPRFRAFNRSQVETLLFDATTDLEVPVVYCLMVARTHPSAAVVVTAASELDPVEACAKAMREGVSTRLAVLSAADRPQSAEECYKLEHGAAYMGDVKRLEHFEFLLQSQATVHLKDLAPPTGEAAGARERLDWLVSRLADQHIEAVAVELTTDELAAVGLRAVRVVIPELMPLSYVTKTRFLAHPRLARFAEKEEGLMFSATHVNPQPQPFA